MDLGTGKGQFLGHAHWPCLHLRQGWHTLLRGMVRAPHTTCPWEHPWLGSPAEPLLASTSALGICSPQETPSRVPWKPSCQSALSSKPWKPSQPKSSRVAWHIRVCSCCTLSLRVWRLLFFMFFKRCWTYIGRRKSHSSKRSNRKHLPPTQDTSSRILFPKE